MSSLTGKTHTQARPQQQESPFTPPPRDELRTIHHHVLVPKAL